MAKQNSTTRRAVLAGAAAVIPATATAGLSTTHTRDPILAVISEHEAAYHSLISNDGEHEELQEALPVEKTQTHVSVYFGPEDIVEGDDPRWIAHAESYVAVSRRYHGAAWALAETVPTTAAGVKALLIYLGKHQDRERERFGDSALNYAWPDRRIGLGDNEDSDQGLWAVRLIESLSRAAQALAVQS